MPYAGLQAVSLHTDAIREVNLNGPTQVGLNVDSRTVNTFRSALGAQFNARVALGEMDLKPFVRAEWAHDFRTPRVATATFQTLPAAGFSVQGARPAKDVFGVTAGAEVTVSKGVALYASVDGEFSGRGNSYAVNAGVRVSW